MTMPWARNVSRDQTPTLTVKPSIHPSGLLQWQAGEFDRAAQILLVADRPVSVVGRGTGVYVAGR